MYLLFRCLGHHSEVRALNFHCSAPLLISGDSVGAVFVWATTTSMTASGESAPTYSIRPLMALLVANRSAIPRTPNSGGRSTHRGDDRAVPPTGRRVGDDYEGEEVLRRPHRVGITSICSTAEPHASVFAGDSDGVVHQWDLRALQHIAHKRGIPASHFESRRSITDDLTGSGDANSTTTSSATDAALNLFLPQHQHQPKRQQQQLRFNHKLSILRLQGDDRHWFRGLPPTQTTPQLPSTVTSSETSLQGDGSRTHRGASIPGCHASCTWMAHTAPVAGVSSVPFPGAAFSFSTDCSVKVWDWDGGCMGQFATSKSPPTTSTKSSSPSTEPDEKSQPLAWKFTRHLTGDESAQHLRIAMEVIRKHQRQSRRGEVSPSPKENYELGCEDTDADVFSDSQQWSTKPAMPSPLKTHTRDDAAIPFTRESSLYPICLLTSV